MISDTLKKALNYQEWDTKVIHLSQQLDAVPGEIARIRESIANEEAGIARQQQEIAACELKRSKAELEIESLESQITKFKTQQITVKKTEEYQAFNEQIRNAEAKVSDSEDSVLEILEEIDSRNGRLDTERKACSERVAYLNGVIVEWEQKALSIASELKTASAALEKTQKDVPQTLMASYSRLKSQGKRPPCIVPVRDQCCGGCHMKVSNDTLKKARMGELAACDQCSRILYVED
ncbi:MAG: putative zinc ribbon domain protein [Verrucomicrobia bacterium ADurb.Bin474]|nr:MAG: putative zinc ribbon domain protein [Verrucomicrobia bacterium ADurb.Bin474]